MPKRKIIVPMDFSQHSVAALNYAEAFAKGSDAELLIVHVVDDLPTLNSVSPAETLDGLRDALYSVVPDDKTVKYSHRLLEGKPTDAILALSEENDTEMIVMGTHGRQGFNRILMGSVAEWIVRKATCPVLTVRHRDALPESPSKLRTETISS